MNFQFMHINKTAGQSVVEWFELNNIRINDFENKYKTFDKNKFYFTIVRNPYDRVASQFFHWRDNLKRIKPNITLNEYIENFEDSSQWLINGHHPKFYKRYNEPCSDWILSEQYKVFKFEEMDIFKSYFIENFGFKDNFPHKNKSKAAKSYVEQYNSDSIVKINKIFENDFEKFNYKIL